MGIEIKLCYFKPSSNLNQDLVKLYEGNICGITRQFPYSKNNNNTIDTVLSINGIPLFAFELKDQLKGQDVNNAMRQWKEDRDPKEPIFKFGHSLSIYINNQENIVNLFECVIDFDYASKVRCLELLFKYSNNFKTFKKINLNPTLISFFGSEVPYIRSRISFYEKIKEIVPSEPYFIDHLFYIDEILQSLKKSISQTLINEKKLSSRLNW